MKIVFDNHVYVQKNDIMYLLENDNKNVTALERIALKYKKTIENADRYDFIKFKSKIDCNFFNNIDYIIDYNKVKDLSCKELIDMGMSLASERRELASKYNNMDIIDRQRNFYIKIRCKELYYKMYSLGEVLWYKQGRININMPNEIENNIKKEEDKKLSKNLWKFKK